MKVCITATLLLFTLNTYAQTNEPPPFSNDPNLPVFKYVEQMPEAPYDVSEFLSANIVYPQAALDSNIGGRVEIRFIVDEKGKITNVKSVGKKMLGYGLEEEAIRVVSSLPDWIPGKQVGKPVKVFYTLPIAFKTSGAAKKL